MLAVASSVLAQAVAAGEVLAEVRVHGNYSTPDAEVLRLAGLTTGQAITPATIDAAVDRLKRSDRFIAVEIRKRYRSLDDQTDVALIIIVQEYPIPDVAPSLMRPLRRTLGSAMFMPILNFTDGYGLTYGGRVSFVDGLGKGARLSVPLTWGGTKRAAAEFEKSVARGPFDRVTATVSIGRRTNPFYEVDDDRRTAALGASRQIVGPVRAGLQAGISNVTFGTIEDRLTTYGADVTLDTRADPTFPRNAVFVTARWERLDARPTPAGGSVPAAAIRGQLDRLFLDARGYVGVIGQSVLSMRAQLGRANAPLPLYERFLLGGADTLRGYRAGSFSGDTLAAGSLELRIPISSPLSFGRAGVELFTDAGTVLDRGTPFRDARFHAGYGGGVFFIASIFQLNADIAARRDGLRLHVMSGFHF